MKFKLKISSKFLFNRYVLNLIILDSALSKSYKFLKNLTEIWVFNQSYVNLKLFYNLWLLDNKEKK